MGIGTTWKKGALKRIKVGGGGVSKGEGGYGKREPCGGVLKEEEKDWLEKKGSRGVFSA